MDIYNYISDCYNSLKTFIRLPSLSAQFCFVRDKIRKIWRDCSPPSKYSTDKYKHAIDTLKKELNSEIGVKLYFDRTSLEPLKDQSRKRFLSAVQNLYDELKQERVEDIREQYENIHKFLRIAIESPCYKKKENETYCKFLQSFCRAKFEKNVMFEHHESYLKNINIQVFSLDGLNLESFAEQVKKVNEELKKVPEKKGKFDLMIQKLEGIGLLPADNIGKSNIPEVRAYHKYDGKKEVIVLRHGTVVISPEGILKIAPEYECYLDALEKEEQNILYVNHQRCDPSQFSAAQIFDSQEIDRSKMIHNLEKNHTNFHAMSLPMNGAVFKFVGKKGELKTLLVHSIINQENGFKLPKGFEISKEDIENMFEHIQSLYFDDGLDCFDKEQSQEFLMIFYSYLKEKVKNTMSINVMECVCKDDKDRGNVSKFVDELLMGFHSKQLEDETFLRDLFVRFFGAFMIKNEAIINERVDLGINILKRLKNLRGSSKFEWLNGKNEFQAGMDRLNSLIINNADSFEKKVEKYRNDFKKSDRWAASELATILGYKTQTHFPHLKIAGGRASPPLSSDDDFPKVLQPPSPSASNLNSVTNRGPIESQLNSPSPSEGTQSLISRNESRFDRSNPSSVPRSESPILNSERSFSPEMFHSGFMQVEHLLGFKNPLFALPRKRPYFWERPTLNQTFPVSVNSLSSWFYRK